MPSVNDQSNQLNASKDVDPLSMLATTAPSPTNGIVATDEVVNSSSSHEGNTQKGSSSLQRQFSSAQSIDHTPALKADSMPPSAELGTSPHSTQSSTVAGASDRDGGMSVDQPEINSTYNKSQAPRGGLGTLSCLPPEVRLMIFRRVMIIDDIVSSWPHSFDLPPGIDPTQLTALAQSNLMTIYRNGRSYNQNIRLVSKAWNAECLPLAMSRTRAHFFWIYDIDHPFRFISGSLVPFIPVVTLNIHMRQLTEITSPAIHEPIRLVRQFSSSGSRHDWFCVSIENCHPRAIDLLPVLKEMRTLTNFKVVTIMVTYCTDWVRILDELDLDDREDDIDDDDDEDHNDDDNDRDNDEDEKKDDDDKYRPDPIETIREVLDKFLGRPEIHRSGESEDRPKEYDFEVQECRYTRLTYYPINRHEQLEARSAHLAKKLVCGKGRDDAPQESKRCLRKRNAREYFIWRMRRCIAAFKTRQELKKKWHMCPNDRFFMFPRIGRLIAIGYEDYCFFESLAVGEIHPFTEHVRPVSWTRHRSFMKAPNWKNWEPNPALSNREKLLMQMAEGGGNVEVGNEPITELICAMDREGRGIRSGWEDLKSDPRDDSADNSGPARLKDLPILTIREAAAAALARTETMVKNDQALLGREDYILEHIARAIYDVVCLVEPSIGFAAVKEFKFTSEYPFNPEHVVAVAQEKVAELIAKAADELVAEDEADARSGTISEVILEAVDKIIVHEFKAMDKMIDEVKSEAESSSDHEAVDKMIVEIESEVGSSSDPILVE